MYCINLEEEFGLPWQHSKGLLKKELIEYHLWKKELFLAPNLIKMFHLAFCSQLFSTLVRPLLPCICYLLKKWCQIFCVIYHWLHYCCSTIGSSYPYVFPQRLEQKYDCITFWAHSTLGPYSEVITHRYLPSIHSHTHSNWINIIGWEI